MGEIYAPHNLTEFGEQDDYDVDLLNSNFRKLSDQLVAEITPGTTAGKPRRSFKGYFDVTNGAGAIKANAGATDANGVGAIFLGEKGIPSFEKILYVSLAHANTGQDAVLNQSLVTVIAVTATFPDKIQFVARRLQTNTWAGQYGNLPMWVDIMGW